ncbi:MAG: hypothetical protein ACTSWK_00385 [Promethearchaeota archaeon]
MSGELCVEKNSDLERLEHNVHEFEKDLESTKERLELLVESLKINCTEELKDETPPPKISSIPTNKISNISENLNRFTQIVQEINLKISYLEGVLK